MIREANLHWRHEDTETGLIMPWYTLPCLQWLKSQETKDWNVFEYGAGYSTIWWRVNSRNLYSIESDYTWAKAVDADIETIESLYIKSIEEWYSQNGCQCVVVDGMNRLDCVDFSRDFIAPGGYLIFDNYNQEGFEDKHAIDKLLEGWEKQVFKQPNHTDWSTAVFKKPQ